MEEIEILQPAAERNAPYLLRPETGREIPGVKHDAGAVFGFVKPEDFGRHSAELLNSPRHAVEAVLRPLIGPAAPAVAGNRIGEGAVARIYAGRECA